MPAAAISNKKDISMRTSAKPVLTALVAALLLASVVSSAFARNLRVSSRTFRVTWSSLEFAEPVTRITMRCQVTLEGSFHSATIAKVERLLIGAITRANVKEESCTGGRDRPNNETLPWHVTYENFTGTLPNISTVGLLLSRVSFNIEMPLVCTGRYGISTDNISGSAAREAGGGITTLSPVRGRNFATLERTISGACPTRVSFEGTGATFVLGTTARITVTLI
jgi:hypothetical protein